MKMVQGLGPIKIVMIDDDSDDIFLTKIACKRSVSSIDFKGLASGAALYDHIKYNGMGSIDIILLDVNMPVENGYEVLKKLKAYPNFNDVNVVMFSTTRRPHEKELELGATDFIEKPSSVAEVDNFIKRLESYSSKVSSVLQAAE